MSHIPQKIIDVKEEQENGQTVFVLECHDIQPVLNRVKLKKASAASINKLRELKGKNAMLPLTAYLVNGTAGYSFKEAPIFELPTISKPT